MLDLLIIIMLYNDGLWLVVLMMLGVTHTTILEEANDVSWYKNKSVYLNNATMHLS